MLPLTGVHESPGKTKFRIPAKRNLIVAIAALIGQLFIHLINFSNVFLHLINFSHQLVLACSVRVPRAGACRSRLPWPSPPRLLSRGLLVFTPQSQRCRHFRCCTPLHCYGFPHRGRLRSGGSRGRRIRRSRPHSRPLVPLARMAGAVCCWDGRTGLLHFSRAGHYAVVAAT
uniref:Uncharacterized protein n=1 Tax=Setaria viridis TaxID=4556 RepID=A0A4U6T3X0_SETVI|nr:hypothetical protein SEVIR_9G361900v2 [Setaria viridis]